MTVKLRTLTVSILLTLPLASIALERAELLPPNAQSHVRVSNTIDFWSQLKLSSIGKLWADPQFQDFLGNPDADTLQEALFDGEPDAEDQAMIEQIKMLKGEIVIGMDLDKEEPYIIAAMSKDDFAKSLEMDAKLKDSTDQAFDIIKDTFQDVEIIQYINDGGTPDELSTWQAHIGSTLIYGYSKEWVEKCIVQLKKDEIKEPKGNPVLTLDIPLARLIRQIIEEEKEAGAGMQEPFEIEQLFDALGLMGVQHYSLKIELKENELVADNNLRISDLSKGFFTILDVQPSKLPNVTFIPEDIASIEVGRFNLLGFWQEIPNVLANVMPEMKPQYDMILGMIQAQAGINFEQDLLSHLDTRYVSFSVSEGEEQQAVVAVGLKDSAAFKTGLETALSAPGMQAPVAASLKTEQFLDHTLYTVIGEEPDSIAFGVAADHLLYGDPDGIRQVIRRAGRDETADASYEQSSLVKGLRTQVPDRAFGFGAVDWKKNMDDLVREFSKPEYSMMLKDNWASSGIMLPPPDFSKIPPANHIASFFNVSYQYAEATGDGIHQRIILKY